jgi:hypothetical protein
MADTKASLKEVREFFHTERRPFKLADMKAEWLKLTADDKTQILNGLGDGSLTY